DQRQPGSHTNRPIVVSSRLTMSIRPLEKVRTWSGVVKLLRWRRGIDAILRRRRRPCPRHRQPDRPRLSVMSDLRVGSIVIRVDDIDRQAEFWEAALGYERRRGQDADFILLRPKDGVGPNVSLDQVRSE